MSAAFTSLSSGGNAQSLAMANELVLAYSERGGSASLLVSGDNAQDKTLWRAMQVWLESNCASFVDHVNGPLNSGGTDFLYFTLATWRAAAGLNANGFRYSIDGSTILYGNIYSGDVRGKWCFEELQKGFGALKWRPGTVDWLPVSSCYGEGSAQNADPGDAIAEAKGAAADNYTCTSSYSTPGAHSLWGSSLIWNEETHHTDTVAYAEIGRGKTTPTVATSTIPHVVLLYGRGTKVGDSYNAFGDGFSEGTAYSVIQSSGEETSAMWEGSAIGSTSAPEWAGGEYRGSQAYSGQCIALIKYNFTNA